jgi:tetratricopeptide (TPR) repeat protein
MTGKGSCFYLLLSILALAGCQAPDSSSSNEETPETDTVKTADTSSQRRQRIRSLSETLTKNPRQPEKQFRLAKLYTQQEHYLKAREAIEKALTLDSANADYHYWSGRIYWNLDAAKQAINRTKRALDYDPDMTGAHLALGKYFFYMKKRKKSFNHLNEALRQDELQDEAYLYKGLNYEEMGDTADAMSNFQTVTEINPDNYRAHLHLGNLHSSEPKTAIDYLNNAVRIAPDNIAARYSRGYTYQKLRKYDKARKDYKHILEQSADHKQANYNMGYLQYLDTNYRKAVTRFDKVLKKDSAHLKAHLGKGLCYQELGQKQAAKRHLNRVVDMAPQNRLARETLRELSAQ